MSELILLRHGQSQWNLENRFTGWVDVPLSPKGEEEARKAGEKLEGRQIDEVFTSVLKRAIDTTDLALAAAGIGARGDGRAADDPRRRTERAQVRRSAGAEQGRGREEVG